MELCEFSFATTWPVAIDQHELALVLPDGERPALLQITTTVLGRRRSTVACSTHDSVSMRWRAMLDREAEDRIALADTDRRAQQRFRRVGASFDDDVLTRRPAAAWHCQVVRAGSPACRRCGWSGAHQRTRPRRPCRSAPGRRTQQPPLSAQQQLQPAGPVAHRRSRAAGYTRHAAFSTIHAHSCEKFMP